MKQTNRFWANYYKSLTWIFRPFWGITLQSPPIKRCDLSGPKTPKWWQVAVPKQTSPFFWNLSLTKQNKKTPFKMVCFIRFCLMFATNQPRQFFFSKHFASSPLENNITLCRESTTEFQPMSHALGQHPFLLQEVPRFIRLQYLQFNEETVESGLKSWNYCKHLEPQGQPFNKWMEMVISNHFLFLKIWNHPIETTIHKWMFGDFQPFSI